MRTNEALETIQAKRRVLAILHEQSLETGWIVQDCRNLLKSGEVRYYRYRDGSTVLEVPQFYEEYRAVYHRNELTGSHYAASIPSGGDGVWDNDADLMTTYGIDTANGEIRITQGLAPCKKITGADWDRIQQYSLYGVDRQNEEVQWQILGEVLEIN